MTRVGHLATRYKHITQQSWHDIVASVGRYPFYSTEFGQILNECEWKWVCQSVWAFGSLALSSSVCDTITPGFGTACHSLRLLSAVDLVMLTCAAIIIRLAQLELYPVVYNHRVAGDCTRRCPVEDWHPQESGLVSTGVHCGNFNDQSYCSVLKYEYNAELLLYLHHNAR